MNCVGFEKHHFLKCFVFLQSRYRSFPRNNTSANSLDYVQTNVSRLLPVHHHKYEYHYRIRWKMYNRCRIRPTQPVFPRRFLEAHRMEFLCLFVASIPLVVLNNMTDNFLQTTFKTVLNSFLEVRRLHQSHPPSVTTWKVVIPLSAPYREWQVWFAKLKIKIFENFWV